MAATVEKLVQKLTSEIGNVWMSKLKRVMDCNDMNNHRHLPLFSLSPFFVDYTFLTDFFLIYRLFISPLCLLKLLLARFQWALQDDTPPRQIVRVRTFVTMRHWLLNYFEYDFMSCKVLRRTLVHNLKTLLDHPLVQSSVRDQRIFKELRRLFQLKKKVHCREVAQMALENPLIRQSEGHSRRPSSQRQPVNPGKLP